ncbi:MAG: hypothetical protein ACRETG_11565, partial [Steroidobacteraceae bacterium]
SHANLLEGLTRHDLRDADGEIRKTAAAFKAARYALIPCRDAFVPQRELPATAPRGAARRDADAARSRPADRRARPGALESATGP